jgi:hypothetical protein
LSIWLLLGAVVALDFVAVAAVAVVCLRVLVA